MARKGRVFPKETKVTCEYEGRGLGLHSPSRNTGRGVYGCGELKEFNSQGEGKPTSPQLA